MKLKELYNQIKLKPILWKKREWELLNDVQYTFKTFWKPFIIYIPKWFRFDWASCPRVFHIIWTPMWIDTLAGALFHDFLYRKQILSREYSDQCFNELMFETNTKQIKRVLFYIWVRIWGWVAWKNNKKLYKIKK